MRIQATAPFAVAGKHHEHLGPDGQPAIYDFPDDVAAQVVVAGRAVKLPDLPPEQPAA